MIGTCEQCGAGPAQPVELERPDGSIQRLSGRAVMGSELVAGGFKTVARAVRYRLDHTAIEDDGERHRFEELAVASELALPEPKKFAMYQMPRYVFVSAATAYPAANDAREEAVAS